MKRPEDWAPEDWDRIRQLTITDAHYEIQFALMTWDHGIDAACQRVINMYRLYKRLNLPTPYKSAATALEVAAS